MARKKTKNTRDVPIERTEDLKSLNRFSADHIVRTKYNPSTKAVVMEDIPAGLKSEFTLGEGGGGGITNTILTMNIVNNTGESFQGNAYKLDEDLNKVVYDFLEIGETAEVETLVIPVYYEGEYRYMIQPTSLLYPPTPPTASDPVNCTIETDPFGGLTVTITDITLPASLTLTCGA